MPSHLSHLQLNVAPSNLPFYADLMAYLGWATIYADATMLGVGHDRTGLWFSTTTNAAGNDYDGPGLNHLALGVESCDAVDAAARYLADRSVTLLFDTPRHRAEFAGPGATYYQIMFETPDRLLFEIVYEGPWPPPTP